MAETGEITNAIRGSVRRRAHPAEAAAIALISFVLLLLAMPRDLGIYDEGIVFTAAMQVGHGEVIHRDFYSLYGPAQYYIVAMMQKMFRDSFFAARLYDIMIRAGIFLATYLILRRICSIWTAALFSGVAGLWIATIGSYLYPIFPCILLSLIASHRIIGISLGAPRFAPFLACGMLSGLAALFRYDAAAYLLIANILGTIALALLTEPNGTRLRQCTRRTVALAAGALLVFAPFAVAFVIVSPIGAFLYDVVLFPAQFYAAMRGLPFPRWQAMRDDWASAAVYLPFLCIALTGAELLWWLPWRRDPRRYTRPIPLDTAYLIVFGATSALLLLKGLVRVSPLHMLMSLVPALIVFAILCDRWWRAGLIGRLATSAVLLAVVLPVAGSAASFARAMYWEGDGSMVGWLVAATGLPGTARLIQDCETAPGSGLARLRPDDTRVATYLATHSRPDERIFVGLDRTDKVFINAMALYYAAGRLPGTHWSEFDAGLQSRADIQAAIIKDLQGFGVRWIVRDATFAGVHEPNASALSSGVNLLDQYIDAHYRKVAESGKIEVWLANGETLAAAQPTLCEAVQLP